MISANTLWIGAESISAPVSFLTDMDGADMESAPTFVNMVWHNDKFMQRHALSWIFDAGRSSFVFEKWPE